MGAIAREAGIEGTGGEEDADVLVLAPARIGFLDRWASDVEGARRGAQQTLVATVAALAKAGIAAEARVGDEDVLQAIEDQLQTPPTRCSWSAQETRTPSARLMPRRNWNRASRSSSGIWSSAGTELARGALADVQLLAPEPQSPKQTEPATEEDQRSDAQTSPSTLPLD